jgi:hypothetical protein
MTAATLPLFPTFPGIDIDTIWRPKALNFNPQIHASGREVIVSAGQLPLHEFELIFNVLRATPTYSTAEFQTLMGFFLQSYGIATPFQYKNPYDFKVTGQLCKEITTTQFLLQRTYGAGGFTATEPIGFVDLGSTFNVYANGVLTGGYTVDYSSGPPTGGGAGQVLLNFSGAPALPVTVDMSYFYYCRFGDDSIDFEEVLWNVFQMKKLLIVSKRGPAPS